MSKGNLFFFQWDQAAAEETATALREQGWQVDFEAEDGARGSKTVKAAAPDVLVFFLTNMPSHSRATAEYLSSLPTISEVPMLFVGGEGKELDKTKARLPNGIFISEAELAGKLDGLAK